MTDYSRISEAVQAVFSEEEATAVFVTQVSVIAEVFMDGERILIDAHFDGSGDASEITNWQRKGILVDTLDSIRCRELLVNLPEASADDDQDSEVEQ